MATQREAVSPRIRGAFGAVAQQKWRSAVETTVVLGSNVDFFLPLMESTQRVIYFAGSIRGGRDDSALYAQLIERLRKFGRVLTEHVGASLTTGGETGSAREIHDRDLTWLKSAHYLVAEVTTPSLGVGYEIARATEWGKPVLCLFRSGATGSLSAMISGCPQVMVREYAAVADADSILEEFFSR